MKIQETITFTPEDMEVITLLRLSHRLMMEGTFTCGTKAGCAKCPFEQTKSGYCKIQNLFMTIDDFLKFIDEKEEK